MNLDILRQLAEDVFTPLEPKGIKSRLLKYVVERGEYLGVTGGRIWERRGDEYQLVEQLGYDESKIGSRFPADHSYITSILKNNHILYRRNDNGRDHSLEDDLNIGDFIAVPIGIDGKYIAAFDITDEYNKRRIQLSLLNVISIISRTALPEAERLSQIQHEKGQIERELELAYEIQTSILPSEMPQFQNYDVYGVSKPVKNRRIGVGGDYFSTKSGDVLELSIGDVAGKGPIAARHARDLHLAKLTAQKFDPDMSKLIEKLNSVFYETASLTEDGKYVTFFYSEIDSKGNIKYINAGHDNPLLLQDGNFTELDIGGIPLGVFPETSYDLGTQKINPDGVLVLYTDGITETMNKESDFFGEDRLKEVVYKNRHSTAKGITASILEATKKHRNRTQKTDDRTLLVLRSNGNNI